MEIIECIEKGKLKYFTSLNMNCCECSISLEKGGFCSVYLIRKYISINVSICKQCLEKALKLSEEV